MRAWQQLLPLMVGCVLGLTPPAVLCLNVVLLQRQQSRDALMFRNNPPKTGLHQGVGSTVVSSQAVGLMVLWMDANPA